MARSRYTKDNNPGETSSSSHSEPETTRRGAVRGASNNEGGFVGYMKDQWVVRGWKQAVNIVDACITLIRLILWWWRFDVAIK